MQVFVVNGLLGGLGGVIYATRWSSIQPNAGVGLELYVITAVVVGGTNIFGGSGTPIGTCIAVLLLGLINSALTYLKVSTFWVQAVQGGLVILAVMVDAFRERIRRQAQARAQAAAVEGGGT